MRKSGIPLKDKWPIYSQVKLIPPYKLKELSLSLRKEKQTIATVNGSFDLMHAGHLHILFEASKLADCLIVAINTDDSIKRYKGENRPIIPLQYRLQMMTAIGFVDYVTFFDEDDPRDILEVIKPDFHVNGPEWGVECVEADIVKKHGGQIHIITLKEGLSTSKIVETIHNLHDLKTGISETSKSVS